MSGAYAATLPDRERRRDAAILLSAQPLRLHAAAWTPIEGFLRRKPVVVRTNAQPGRAAWSCRLAPLSPLTKVTAGRHAEVDAGVKH